MSIIDICTDLIKVIKLGPESFSDEIYDIIQLEATTHNMEELAKLLREKLNDS